MAAFYRAMVMGGGGLRGRVGRANCCGSLLTYARKARETSALSPGASPRRRSASRSVGCNKSPYINRVELNSALYEGRLAVLRRWCVTLLMNGSETAARCCGWGRRPR